MAPVSNIVKSIQDIMRKDAGTYGAPPSPSRNASWPRSTS